MSEKRSNKKFFLGIAVAVLLPLSFYLVTNELSKGKVKMPGHYKVDSVVNREVSGQTIEDTIYHRVSDLVLTNQLGQVVNIDSMLKGKILVFDFFFTSCPSICPKLTTHMKLLQTSFKKDPKKEASLDTVVQFISITVNPERDTFQLLRAYADRYGVNHDNWWFLTGDKRTIYNFARHELGVTTGPGDGGAEDFIHTEKFVLVDKDRFIRGYYNGTQDTDVRKCADDIVLLTMENKHKH
jgi:protein SCO1